MIRNTRYAANRWSWLASASLTLLAAPAFAEYQLDCLIQSQSKAVEVTVSPGDCIADPTHPSGVNCCIAAPTAGAFVKVYQDGVEVTNPTFCQFSGNSSTGQFGKDTNDIQITCSTGDWSGTCSGQITVQDTTPPQMVCPPKYYDCDGVFQDERPSAYSPCEVPSKTCWLEIDGQRQLWDDWQRFDLKEQIAAGAKLAYRCKAWTTKSTEARECGNTISPSPAAYVMMAFPRTISMWPPNHKYWEQTPADCSDDVVLQNTCFPFDSKTLDRSSEVDWTVDAITSSQVEDDALDSGGERGDGRTCSDAQITGRGSFSLRAERMGGTKEGRTYRVHYSARALSMPEAWPYVDWCTYTVAHSVSQPVTPSYECRYCTDTAPDAFLASWGAPSSYCAMMGCTPPSLMCGN